MNKKKPIAAAVLGVAIAAAAAAAPASADVTHGASTGWIISPTYTKSISATGLTAKINTNYSGYATYSGLQTHMKFTQGQSEVFVTSSTRPTSIQYNTRVSIGGVTFTSVDVGAGVTVGGSLITKTATWKGSTVTSSFVASQKLTTVDFYAVNLGRWTMGTDGKVRYGTTDYFFDL